MQDSNQTHTTQGHGSALPGITGGLPAKALLINEKEEGVAATAEGTSSFTGDTLRFSDPGLRENQADVWKGHELKPTHSSPRPLTDSTPDWLFLILLLVLGMLTYLRVFYRKNFFQIISACFNNNLTNQIVRDENLLMQRAAILLNITFSIIAASFIYLVSIQYDWKVNGIGAGFLRFMFFALLVSAAFTLKFLLLRLCAYLFNLGREMATYIFNVFIINNLLGLTLIPVIALILFGSGLSASVLIILALALAAVAYLYRIGRGFLIALGYSGFSPVYLFLYLCALEIAPLLVLVKLVSMQ